MKILFVSRAYPPVTGGIENQNYELSVHLPKVTPTTTIANTHGKKALPFFLPWMLVRLLFAMPRYDVLLLGDGVLGILGWWTKIFFPQKKVSSIVHGLDLTYKNSFYQKWWVGKFIPACDQLIAVGNQTIIEGVARGIAEEKFVFVPNGIDPSKFTDDTYTRNDLLKIIGDEHAHDKILLTFGRLAKRKGVAWFIRTVLPQLPDNVFYVVAGDGPDRDNIESAITETKMDDRVMMLGRVSDDVRGTLMHTCDLFIQANITVDGDMEGFGISVIEASASGITVVASHLEGLKDAITEGENGFSVPHEDAAAWKTKIEQLLGNEFDLDAFGKKSRAFTIEHYSWDKIAQQYHETLEKA